jgi:hypothetical protein
MLFFSDDDFEQKLLRCILPKPTVSHPLPRQHAADASRRQAPRKNQKANASAAAATSAPVPTPVQGPTAAQSHQAAEPDAAHLHDAHVRRVAVEASDWDEAEIASAVALSLADQQSSPSRTNIDDARSHGSHLASRPQALSSHAAIVPIVRPMRVDDVHPLADANPGALLDCRNDGNEGSDNVQHWAEDCEFYDEATLTGGCMPASAGQGEDGAAAAHDDSILDISFHDDNLRGKPVSKRQARVHAAAAKLRQISNPLEAVEDVDFTPTLKRPRARTATKASAKVARPEEDVAREQSDTLSRKNLTSAMKSAKLGLLRPGLAAECRCTLLAGSISHLVRFFNTLITQAARVCRHWNCSNRAWD